MDDTSYAFSELAVPDHIRQLHVTWLKVIRYYHLQCENLGIETIGRMLNAPQDELRLLLMFDGSAAELREAMHALATRYPEPFDVEAAQWRELAVELARMTSIVRP